MSKSNTADMLRRIEMRVAELGMTKEEFYEKSGISSASYSQWNTGTHAPTKKKMAQAAAALNVSLEYILTGETKKELTTVSGSELTEEAKEIARAFDAAGTELKSRIKDTAFGRNNAYAAVARIEMVCPLGYGKQTIYQPVYCVSGKTFPEARNNGCENYHPCSECEKCRADAILRAFEWEPLDCDRI